MHERARVPDDAIWQSRWSVCVCQMVLEFNHVTVFLPSVRRSQGLHDPQRPLYAYPQQRQADHRRHAARQQNQRRAFQRQRCEHYRGEARSAVNWLCEHYDMW